jgi:H+/Cl- antiporter ClcA
MSISPENRSELEKRYRSTVIVIVFQIFTVIALIIAAWFVAQTSENSITNQSLTTLWVAVLFIAVGAFVLRRLIFNWERLKNTALLKGIKGLIQKLQINSIILGAIAEIVAIMGFLIAVLSGNKWDVFRAGAIALVVFLANFPRKSNWEKIVANLEKI